MNSSSRITNINFLGAFKIALFISLVAIFGSIYLFFSLGNKKYGVDFSGGHEIVIKANGLKASDPIRLALNTAGFTNTVVQAFEADSSEFLIKLDADRIDTETIKTELTQTLNQGLNQQIEIIKHDYIGPIIGKELRQSALIAIIFALIGMLIYISFRFEFAFAFGAVVALFHDVIVATGIYLCMGKSFSMGAVAAALTIVGYSINDTIVVFDRIREEIFKAKEYDLVRIMNYSINATLSRTIITSLLTLFSAGALYFYGGGAISDLSLYLLAGIIVGSYSTIYIACPLIIFWHNFSKRS